MLANLTRRPVVSPEMAKTRDADDVRQTGRQYCGVKRRTIAFCRPAAQPAPAIVVLRA